MFGVAGLLFADAPLRHQAILEVTVLAQHAFLCGRGHKTAAPFAAVEASFEPHPNLCAGVLHAFPWGFTTLWEPVGPRFERKDGTVKRLFLISAADFPSKEVECSGCSGDALTLALAGEPVDHWRVSRRSADGKDWFFGTLTGFLKIVVGKARFFGTLTGFLNMFKENL